MKNHSLVLMIYGLMILPALVHGFKCLPAYAWTSLMLIIITIPNAIDIIKKDLK